MRGEKYRAFLATHPAAQKRREELAAQTDQCMHVVNGVRCPNTKATHIMDMVHPFDDYMGHDWVASLKATQLWCRPCHYAWDGGADYRDLDMWYSQPERWRTLGRLLEIHQGVLSRDQAGELGVPIYTGNPLEKQLHERIDQLESSLAGIEARLQDHIDERLKAMEARLLEHLEADRVRVRRH